MEFLRVYSMGKGGGVERGNIKKYVSLFFYYTGRNTRNHEGLDDDVVTFILFFFLRLSYHLLMLVMTLVTAYKLVFKKLLHVALVSTYLKWAMILSLPRFFPDHLFSLCSFTCLCSTFNCKKIGPQKITSITYLLTIQNRIL